VGVGCVLYAPSSLYSLIGKLEGGGQSWFRCFGEDTKPMGLWNPKDDFLVIQPIT